MEGKGRNSEPEDWLACCSFCTVKALYDFFNARIRHVSKTREKLPRVFHKENPDARISSPLSNLSYLCSAEGS